MSVITISRQIGSNGFQIAEVVAQNLGYRLVWREVINEAAIRAGVPEVALATIDELDLLGLRPSIAAQKAYHAAVREFMQELADQGNVVIVGRAGQVILHGIEDVFHVRVCAPLPTRIERIALRHHVNLETAQNQVKATDQSRTRYLKRNYGAKVDDMDWYDLLLNTARIDCGTAARVVCEMVSEKKNT
jgi:cytidylate kinase